EVIMKTLYFIILLFSLLIIPRPLRAQTLQTIQITWAYDGTLRQWWNIERREAPDGAYMIIAPILDPKAPSFTDSNVVEGVGYAYRVHICDDMQCEPYSNDVAAVFIPTGTCDPCPTCPPPPPPPTCPPGSPPGKCRK